MQNKFSLAATCVLLAFVSWQTASAATTVRPYKFGFTIEEQQHRQEQRDERGIVMGEFGFITADGIYHVTVYATDEEGKFRIISMKNYPYAGPVAPKSPVPALTTTTRTPPPQSISNAACSGCLLPKPPHKTEIRPLSLPLPPAPVAPAPPQQARPAAAAPTPPPGIFPGAVPARAEQPGRLVPEVYLSQTEKLVQFTMRQLATPSTPAPTTTPAPRVPRPTPPGFPIPGQPVLQLPINHPASLPLITPLRITAQSPFPPLAPAVPLGLVGAGDSGLNVALPFQQSIAQSQVDAALAASQQVNTYTSTRTQTQTLPHGASSSSFASSYSSNYPSGGKQATLKPLNTQVDASSALDSTQLGNVQPASFDVSKLDRIPPATSGPKDLQSHAFGTRPQGGAQGTAQSSLDRIPAGTISRGHVFGNPTPGAVAAQSNQDKIPAADQAESYGNPFVKDSATAHSSPVGIAAGAVATPVHQGVIFGSTPQDFVAAQSLLDSLALGTVPAAFAGAVAQGSVFGAPVKGAAGTLAAASTLAGTAPQLGNVFGSPVKGATGAASSGLAGTSTGTVGAPVQQGQIFGKPAQGSATQAGSPGATSPQGAAAGQLAPGRIPASGGATQGSAAAQQTPVNFNQANLQGSPNTGGLTRPTPERPFLINATPSPLRVPYPVQPTSQSADRLNDKVVNSLQQLVLPVTQSITKLMRGPPALEKFLHQATPVPARLHQSGSPPAVVSPFHELVGTSSHTAAVSPLADAAASLHTAATSPHFTAGVANRQQIVANKLQNNALPVTQHIGDLLVQNTHDTPVPHSTAHTHTPSAPTLSAQPSRTPFAAVGNAAGTQQQPRPQPAGAAKTPTSANSPNLAGTGTQTGQAQFGKPQLASAGTFETGKAGKGATGTGLGAGAGSGTGAGAGAAGAGAGQRGAGATGAGAGSSSSETGDLYHFKYLLDYNGHEETGSRNGNKQGNYFALGDDAVARTIEYIANEFGFQPHISWRKLDQSELRALPKENALKHYEFKWFNKPGE